MGTAPHLFLIAGEPSGDALGASLMAGLRALIPGLRFSGIGGPLMEGQGLDSLFPISELSVMGLAEVLPRLPKLLARLRQASAAVAEAAPDALITIDSPDFCLRVAARARAADPTLKTIHYVAPTVWAWRPERARRMAAHVDHVLALFPFEPPWMQAAGMGCDFVGHPVAAWERPGDDACAAFRADAGIGADERLLLVLPGSRRGEVGRMLPVLAEVVRRACARRPGLRVVLPAVAPLAAEIAAEVGSWPGRPVVLDPRPLSPEAAEMRKRTAFASADLALAASGTVSLELAAMGVPMLIAYRFNWLTTRIVRRRVRLKSATLVNILTDSLAVPEFLFEACTADNITPKLLELLDDPAAGAGQRAAGARAMEMLGRGREPPGMRAARAVAKLIR